MATLTLMHPHWGLREDVSMADAGLTQHNLDVMVEEEQEEDMETGTPLSPTVPTPPGESPMLQGSETEDGPLMTGTVRAPRTALMRILPRIQMSTRMSY